MEKGLSSNPLTGNPSQGQEKAEFSWAGPPVYPNKGISSPGQ